VSLLSERVLGGLLGITDPRTDPRLEFVGGARGVDELECRMAQGGFQAAFALHPTRMADLIRVSDAGAVMPPKSTWFDPKVRSGLAVHLLDDDAGHA